MPFAVSLPIWKSEGSELELPIVRSDGLNCLYAFVPGGHDFPAEVDGGDMVVLEVSGHPDFTAQGSMLQQPWKLFSVQV